MHNGFLKINNINYVYYTTTKRVMNSKLNRNLKN